MNNNNDNGVELNNVIHLGELDYNDFDMLLDKLNKMTYQVKVLNKSCKNKDKKIKELRGVIEKLKNGQHSKPKQHSNKKYKNGRRGTNFNG